MVDSTISQLLHAAARGDRQAHEALIPCLYDELHGMARARLQRERSDHSLQPTELVSEAYLRLVEGSGRFENRAHFFGAAALAMRRVLVDHARRRAAGKRGGQVEPVTFEDLAVETDEPTIDVLGLDEALDELEVENPRLVQTVHLRFFAGFSIKETAEILSVSEATVKRDWTFARAWLLERMSGQSDQ